jgi:hypothetical protein
VRSGQSGDGLPGHVAAPGDWRTPAGANVAQAFGHDAAGGGRNINANPTHGFFKGTADVFSLSMEETGVAIKS